MVEYLVSSGFIDTYLTRATNRALDNGFGVEVAPSHFKYISEREIDTVSGKITSVHLTYDRSSLVHPNNEYRFDSIENLKKEIYLAGAMDAEYCVFHAGEPFDIYEGRRVQSRTKMKYLKNTVEELSEAAQEAGVKLAIENMPVRSNYPQRIGDKVSDFEELFTYLDDKGIDNVYMNFDIGHAHVGDNYVMDFLESPILQEKIIAAHVHDNNKSIDQHRPIMKGRNGGITEEEWRALVTLPNLEYITLELNQAESDMCVALDNKEYLESLRK